MLIKKIIVAFALGVAYTKGWAQAIPVDFSSLDYGLYFFGEDNHQRKFKQGESNPYFDPSKPTMLYIHGWQNGMVFDGRKEIFLSDTILGAPSGFDLAKEWREAGYNAAIFYWTQFADESEVKSAEEKIWTANGRAQMRWLADDCNQGDQESCYHDGPSNASVSDLFVENYIDAFSNSARVRLAGHSLGSQLAIVGTYKLLQASQLGLISQSNIPYRVALLDPAFLQDERVFLQATTGQQASEYAETLIDSGVLVEAYRFSVSTNNGFVGDSNMDLMNQTAFAEVRPWYFYFWQVVEKHISARWWYLHSLQAGELHTEDSSMSALSAASDDDTLRYWMNSDYSLDQSEGRYTTRVSDDEFARQRR